MGNFAKPGKGIKKEEQKKKRFFEFFELLFRKMGSLIKLNLLYLLFCIPIITIGPATVALFKIARYYVEGKPVFLFSDFFDAFKSNLLQGFIMSIISGAIAVVGFEAAIFYFVKTTESAFYFVPLGLIGFVSLVCIFASFYTFLLISSVNLKLFNILKNSVMLAFLGARTNLLTLIFAGGITFISVWYIPISIPVLVVITFSLSALIVTFNSFKYIYKYIIRPYYLTSGEPDPYEVRADEGESIFEDAT